METKTTETTILYDKSGREIRTEITHEAISSVELGETAKGEINVKSVKVYANNPEEAALIATKIMFETRARIEEIANAKLHEQLTASAKA